MPLGQVILMIKSSQETTLKIIQRISKLIEFIYELFYILLWFVYCDKKSRYFKTYSVKRKLKQLFFDMFSRLPLYRNIIRYYTKCHAEYVLCFHFNNYYEKRLQSLVVQGE